MPSAPQSVTATDPSAAARQAADGDWGSNLSASAVKDMSFNAHAADAEAARRAEDGQWGGGMSTAALNDMSTDAQTADSQTADSDASGSGISADRELVQGLLQRFPTATPEEIRQALSVSKNHGGKAANRLRAKHQDYSAPLPEPTEVPASGETRHDFVGGKKFGVDMAAFGSKTMSKEEIDAANASFKTFQSQAPTQHEETVSDARARREAQRVASIKSWMDVVDPSQIKPATAADIELMEAVRHGDGRRAASALFNGADIYREDKVGRTSLLWAAYFGSLDVVNVLLDAGADPTHKDEMWNSAADLAQKNQHYRVVDRLLKPRKMAIRPVRVCAPSGEMLQVRNMHGRLQLPPAFSLGVHYHPMNKVIRSSNANHAAEVERQLSLLSQADQDLPSSRR
jgi:hypothetical protein